MIKKTLPVLASFFLLLIPRIVSAQSPDAEHKYTAFDMRSNGKIYVLTTCMLVIMTGMILYLIRLDRKIGKLEKEIK